MDRVTGQKELANSTQRKAVHAKIGYEATISVVIAEESAILNAKNTTNSVQQIVLMGLTGSVVAVASDWRLRSSSCLMD